MHDDPMPRAIPAQQALRALPLLAPPRSVLPALQRAQAAPRRVRWHWLAMAAALACAALIPRWLPQSPGAPEAPLAASALDPDGAVLAALIAESAQLELLVAWSDGSGVESAPAAALAAGVQDRVVQIDALLARADLDDDARVGLWAERVLRMRELAGLAHSQQLLAASGDGDAGTLVLAF